MDSCAPHNSALTIAVNRPAAGELTLSTFCWWTWINVDACNNRHIHIWSYNQITKNKFSNISHLLFSWEWFARAWEFSSYKNAVLQRPGLVADDIPVISPCLLHISVPGVVSNRISSRSCIALSSFSRNSHAFTRSSTDMHRFGYWMISAYSSLFARNRIKYTFVAIHSIFMATVAMLYAIRASNPPPSGID